MRHPLGSNRIAACHAPTSSFTFLRRSERLTLVAMLALYLLSQLRLHRAQ
jgi:hypothetical protein